jgi:hypothetical protein
LDKIGALEWLKPQKMLGLGPHFMDIFTFPENLASEFQETDLKGKTLETCRS